MDVPDILPRRAPRDPRLRRIYLRELRRLWQQGRLDRPVRPSEVPHELLAALYPAPAGQQGFPGR